MLKHAGKQDQSTLRAKEMWNINRYMLTTQKCQACLGPDTRIRQISQPREKRQIHLFLQQTGFAFEEEITNHYQAIPKSLDTVQSF